MSNSSNRPAAPFFEEPLATRDAPVRSAILKELERQQSQIELIASENIVSRAVLEAQGSVLTNKYAEGYPGKRYYGGSVILPGKEDSARRPRKHTHYIA